MLELNRNPKYYRVQNRLNIVSDNVIYPTSYADPICRAEYTGKYT